MTDDPDDWSDVMGDGLDTVDVFFITAETDEGTEVVRVMGLPEEEMAWVN